MKKYCTSLCILTLLVFSTIATQQVQSAQRVVVHASSTDQIIAEIRRANKSGAPTTIEVAPKRYLFSLVNLTAYGRTALPLIKGDIILHGSGPQTTVFDNGNFDTQNGFGRYISVAPGAHLTVSGIALANAYLICSEAACPGDSSIVGGGALANFGGTVTLDKCDISNNQSSDINGSLGGALYNEAGALTLTRSTVSGNGALGYGGAMYVRSGTVLIQNVLLSGNHSYPPGEFGNGFAFGGAIVVGSGQVTILGSTLSGNEAGDGVDESRAFGGAIMNLGNLVVRNSAIIENSALAVGSGAGIYNAGTAAVENSTIGGNIAGTFGGGLMNEGTLKLTGVTVVDNEAQNGQLDSDCPDCGEGGGGIWNGPGAVSFLQGGARRIDLSSTVIARNTATALGPDCAGVLVSQGYNAIGDTTGCTVRRPESLPATRRDKLNVKARLGSLQENGVPGKAHFPVLKGSPLIDAAGAFPGGCMQLDQEGHARRDGNGDGVVRCDIGSIEF